jgi:CubicO group peptidase (beta-lactamase class C family)
VTAVVALLWLALPAPKAVAQLEDSFRYRGARLAARSGAVAIESAVAAFFESTHASAVQIAVRQHERYVYSKAFGSEDPDGVVPATRRSLFQIGSNTKKATALAVLRAVQVGKLGLDDTLDKVLPELTLTRDPEWSKHATVRQLLSHQSGLWDYTPWIDAPADSELADTVYGTFAEHEWSTTPPRAVWNYSNANFSLLGAVLERVYRAPYARVLERELYRPLGLRHTHARRDGALAAGHAVWSYGLPPSSLLSGYDPWSLYAPPSTGDASEAPALAWVAPDEQEDNAFVRPAGLTWSTAEDECRIGAFLVSGEPEILDDALRGEMFSAQVHTAPSPDSAAYGFGLAVSKHITLGPDEAYDIDFWEHDGATLRMRSDFFVFPKQDLVFSVLTNTSLSDGTESTVWQLLLVSVIRAYVELPSPHAAVPPDPADDGARYTGTYEDPNGFGKVELRWDGMALRISAPDLVALGAQVDEIVTVAQKNVLVVNVDGQPNALEVWPSSTSDAGYLVSRADALTRVDSTN